MASAFQIALNLLSGRELSERQLRERLSRRKCDPDDIAEAVAFLASPRARNITGVELRVDAGQLVG